MGVVWICRPKHVVVIGNDRQQGQTHHTTVTLNLGDALAETVDQVMGAVAEPGRAGRIDGQAVDEVEADVIPRIDPLISNADVCRGAVDCTRGGRHQHILHGHGVDIQQCLEVVMAGTAGCGQAADHGPGVVGQHTRGRQRVGIGQGIENHGETDRATGRCSLQRMAIGAVVQVQLLPLPGDCIE
ncbi:hypothetical protein D3C78_1105570 [compost metagenome]